MATMITDYLQHLYLEFQVNNLLNKPKTATFITIIYHSSLGHRVILPKMRAHFSGTRTQK